MPTIITGKFSPTETTGNYKNYQKYNFIATKNEKNYSMTIIMDMDKVLPGFSFDNKKTRNINKTDKQISFNITEDEFTRLTQPNNSVFNFKKKDFKKVRLKAPCPGEFRAESVEEQTGGSKRKTNKTNKRTKRKNARKSRKQKV